MSEQLTVKQIRQKREALEEEISAMIHKFNQVTGTTIERIELDNIDITCYGKTHPKVQPEIKLYVRL